MKYIKINHEKRLLLGQKILLIAPKYYDYHTKIINELECNGAKVTFYPEMIYPFFYRLMRNISQYCKQELEKKYLNEILKNISDNEYNTFFLIRGEIVTTDFLKKLKLKLPHAKFVMYQWDSLKQNDYESKIKYFDCVQTFDMVDAKALNLTYLPLFYTDDYSLAQMSEKKYDLAFFGSWHGDRLEVIKYIDKEFKKYGLTFKFHLYISKLSIVKSLLLGKITFKDLSFLKTNTVDAKKINQVYKESKAVLDIELAIQNGLTIRTFEVLGSNTKLITTNNNIKEEKFYNPNNIMVIDRKNIKIDFDFFKSPMDTYDFSEYYIGQWLQKILIGKK